jgi:hypothetical protein
LVACSKAELPGNGFPGILLGPWLAGLREVPESRAP